MSHSFYVFTSKKEDIWSKLLSLHIKIVSVDEMFQQFLCIYIEKGGHLVEFYDMLRSFYVFTSKKEDIWSKLLSLHIKIGSVDEMTNSFDVFTSKKEDIDRKSTR